MDRPKLEAVTSLLDWDFFKSRWESIDIKDKKVIHQLLACPDTDLQKLLYREKGLPEQLSETNLLALFKKIAVKSENVWCLRESLHRMVQDTAEPASSFAAQLGPGETVFLHARMLQLQHKE